ncbi:MAG: HPr family phosphocarrier protein, partial [candidate division WOR-3 bacterium]
MTTISSERCDMIKKEILVKNEIGMHIRAAIEFTKVANRFSSEVRLFKDGVWVNGKSIISVLTLGIGNNNRVVLEVKGKDEVACFKALK